YKTTDITIKINTLSFNNKSNFKQDSYLRFILDTIYYRINNILCSASLYPMNHNNEESYVSISISEFPLILSDTISGFMDSLGLNAKLINLSFSYGDEYYASGMTHVVDQTYGSYYPSSEGGHLTFLP